MPAATQLSNRKAYCWGLHLCTLLTACTVFPLIFVGAGVTSKDAGMAYADWPTSAGHLVNPPHWLEKENTRWEHGHRLIGWAVGMLAIASFVLGFPHGGNIRKLTIVVLGVIITQGVLGGFRVWEVSTPLAMVHGIFGQVCFCLASASALISSRTWRDTTRRSSRTAVFLQRLCIIVTGAVFLQLTLGAAYRHFASTGFLVGHVLWAVIVLFVGGWLAMWLMGPQFAKTPMGLLGKMLGGLIALQLILGGAAYIVVVMGVSSTAWLVWAVPTAHTAVGALILVCCVLVTMCTHTMIQPLGSESQPAPNAAVVSST